MNFRPRHISEEEFKIMDNRVRSTNNCNQRGSRRVGVTGVTAVPKANLPRSSPYKSKWELQYSKVLEVEKRVGAIKDWRYGGISFTLSKKQYHRIDFLIWHNNGQIELAQVKGYHKNLRAGIKGLKWAAQLHPWFSWTIKRWTGTAWDGEYVEI